MAWRIGSILAAVGLLGMTGAAPAAQSHDPDWPCIQRKVPELSMPQIWNGPALPESASQWTSDAGVAELVAEVTPRRVPIEEAQQHIREFAAELPPGQSQERLGKVVQGLFDRMNAERSQVISGIARYAHKQVELAGRLRKEAHEVDALRAKPDADPNQVAIMTDRLTWETRVFEERVQSLTFVCEVPTLIEQRLYALTKTVAETLEKK